MAEAALVAMAETTMMQHGSSFSGNGEGLVQRCCEGKGDKRKKKRKNNEEEEK
jgi:hypothetical protein